MPKPTAIKLSSNTIPIISNVLELPEKDIETEWIERNPQSIYYVKDCLYKGLPMPYLVYREREFLEDFASVPPGIEADFVPVTQVKE